MVSMTINSIHSKPLKTKQIISTHANPKKEFTNDKRRVTKTSITDSLGHNLWLIDFFVFVALCPMSTAKVIAGRSVHLTTLFPGQA